VGAAQCSAAVDMTQPEAPPLDFTPLDFLDAYVVVQITTGLGSQSGRVNIWVYGSTDSGVTYGDGMPGTNTSVTLTDPPNLTLLGTKYTSNPMSVAAAFGGRMPEFWGIVVENRLSGAFHTSGNGAWYQGMFELLT